MELKATRTLDDLGRIVLPKELREELGWQIGSAIDIFSKDGTVSMRPAADAAAGECD